MTARPPAVIGLDVGTSGAKGMLADEHGVIAIERRGYALDTGAGGRVELDADAVWDAVASTISRLAALAADRGSRIVAVCCGGSGDEAVWVDAKLRPVAPVPMSLDSRSEADGRALLDRIGSATFRRRTGLPAAGGYPLTRLLWLRRTAPTVADRVRHLWAWPEFVAARLGVSPIAEPTLAARSAAFDVVHGRWDPELQAGLAPDLFPPLAPTGSVAGVVSRSAGRRLGLGSSVVVVAGGFDQAMATLGSGVTRPGLAHLGMGSWEAVTVLVDGPQFDLVDRGFSLGPAIASEVAWSAMGSSIGGAAMAWLGRLGRAGPMGGDPRRDVGRAMRLAARAPDEPTGVVAVPDLDGSSPRAGGDPGGVLAGLRLDVDAPRLARGMLEGVVFGVAEQLRALARDTPIAELRATGAGARERRWLQLRADITGIPVRAVRPVDAGSAAAAALAIAAAIPGHSVASALGALVRWGPLVEPRPAHHARFAELQSRRRALRDALGDSGSPDRPDPVTRAGRPR